MQSRRASARWPVCQGCPFRESREYGPHGHVITHETEHMSFIQRDDLIQDLSATTSNPSLRGSILPGGLEARPLRFQTRRLQKRNDGGIEFRIAVQDQITVWANLRESLAQLLDDPLRTRMSRHVEM